MSTPETIRELGERWARAEVSGDTATLETLSTDDFTLVGPLGFVLDKRQWLARYPGGGLVTHELTWDELSIREYGDAAVVVGRHTQRAAYRGNPADGAFRGTHLLVRRDGRWRLAGIHLSPIGGPPPFAARGGAPTGGR
jgi:ketosteroid isomerase-like protein